MEEDRLLARAIAALGVSEVVPLSVGGQKRVYSAVLEGTPTVVKIVPIPGTGYAEETVIRARREVELLSTVESEHVVKVLSEAVEIGERPEAVCWVEEYLDGNDLTDSISSFPWTSDQVWPLVTDIARGLAACHAFDVVHRDLSPRNVRRKANLRFVLMDPGFARHLSRTAITGLYQPGTPGYMTPEHVPGGQPTPASDIFGLGILAFQALTGELPIPPTEDDATYFNQLRTDQAPPVRERVNEVEEKLAAVVDRCLERQSARRYLDAAELLEELAESDPTS